MNEIELTYSQYHNLVQAITDREQWNDTDLRIAVSVSCVIMAIFLSAVLTTYLTAGIALFVFIPAIVLSLFTPIGIGSLIYAKNLDENKTKAMSRLDGETQEKVKNLPRMFNFILDEKLSVTIIEEEEETEAGNLLRPY